MLFLLAPLILARDFVRQISFARLQLTAALILDGTVFVLQVSGLLVLATYVGLNVSQSFTVICGALAVAIGAIAGAGASAAVRIGSS